MREPERAEAGPTACCTLPIPTKRGTAPPAPRSVMAMTEGADAVRATIPARSACAREGCESLKGPNFDKRSCRSARHDSSKALELRSRSYKLVWA